MLKNCLDFTSQVTVVKRLILASTLLPTEIPKFWNVVSSFATKSVESNLTPEKAKTFIENLHYVEPSAFCLDHHLVKELQSTIVEGNQMLGIILLSPNATCISCGSSLLVRADRPSRVTVYSDTEGTLIGSHYRKICKRFRAGCKFVQHYGYYSIGEESAIIYNENWKEHKYFLSTRETAFEMALLKQFDIEILIGQLSYLQRSEIYNLKHGHDRAKKKSQKSDEKDADLSPSKSRYYNRHS